MQYTLKNRETITGAVSIFTQPVDVSEVPMFTVTTVVHARSGTSPTFNISFETSDNLEDWSPMTSVPAISQDDPGMRVDSVRALSHPYGRYIRCEIVSAGTDPMYNYSLWINTFPNS